MKSIKTFFILLALPFITVSICGCRAYVDRSAIYDDNAELVKEGDRFSYFHRKAEIGSDGAVLEFDDFSGVDTVLNIYAKKGETLNIKYEAKIKRGEFKTVLISPDNDVITLAEANMKGEHEIMAENGKYRVKIVGRNAGGNVSVSYVREDA